MALLVCHRRAGRCATGRSCSSRRCCSCLFGVRAAISLPIDAVPDVTNVQVQVITAAPALSPGRGRAVRDRAGRARDGRHPEDRREVRSISKYGLSVVTVVFDDDTDIYFARQLVERAHARGATTAVPSAVRHARDGADHDRPRRDLPVRRRGNDQLTLMQLEELLDWQIAPAAPHRARRRRGEQLRRRGPAVSGRARSRKRLQAAGVSRRRGRRRPSRSRTPTPAAATSSTIASTSSSAPTGSSRTSTICERSSSARRAQGSRSRSRPSATSSSGRACAAAPPPKDGKGEVVVGVALMLHGRELAHGDARREGEARGAPAVAARRDRGSSRSTTARELVDRTIQHGRRRTSLEGALLVIARPVPARSATCAPALVVATTIPLSMLFAVIVMNAVGLSGNLMSLGAIDFGLIVDGAVIIVENAVRRLAERRRESAAAVRGGARAAIVEARDARGALGASVFGEAIIAIVYVPILALRGIEGKLFRPMATTVLFALARRVRPVAHARPGADELFLVRRESRRDETWLLRQAHALYAPALEPRCVRRGRSPLGAAACVLGARGAGRLTAARRGVRSAARRGRLARRGAPPAGRRAHRVRRDDTAPSRRRC